MSTPSGQVDLPVCREDLVQKAASSTFRPDFDWIDEKQALLVSTRSSNRGLSAAVIRELAREWILDGNRIKCVKETREGYRDRRHFHYDITIGGLAEFPSGLYVYMQLASRDETDPAVWLLNAHPPDKSS